MTDNIRTNHCATCKQMADVNWELHSEIARLRASLADACDYIRGHIIGPVQKEAILREAHAVLTGKAKP